MSSSVAEPHLPAGAISASDGSVGRPEADGKERPDVSLILPTYNERATLLLIHDRIESALAAYSHEIVVVDDSSPDGTADEVRQLAETHPYRLVLRPRKSGLASAVLDGIEQSYGEVVVVMDADGSHPPERLPALINPILRHEAELTVGSRWAPGGREVGLDGVRRKVSRVAALAARQLTTVGDPMTGFFAVRRDILGRATLMPTGFKIGLEIFAKCFANPIVEVPIDFGPRLAGESKLSSLVILSYVVQLERLYVWKLRQSVHRRRREYPYDNLRSNESGGSSTARSQDPTRLL